ncbi:caspase domain-containing protein [Roridomyces roridus]|uniref:Caspase domain-containing protein n=1 Tax=Roridomyces roridus TaxID=1738132 RepID=A0AAD7B8U8_9AGAR|nr:caspase domain-containing protein [Roridomyces roridus]
MNPIGNWSTTTLVPPTVVCQKSGGPFPRKEGQNLKALLIGVCGTANACTDFPALPAAHRDVEKMKMLLIERYYYRPCDIITLIDDGVSDHMQPTRNNILKAINELVKDAKPGDRFGFHYSGHSAQIKSCSNDGSMDECLVPCDSNGSANVITDTELNAALVMPLPAGSQLVAILDACHSGSLLDLEHRRGMSMSVSVGSLTLRAPPRKNARLLSIPSNQKKLPPPQPATRLLARRREISMNLTCDPPPPSSRASDCDYKPQDVSVPRPTYTYRAPTTAASTIPKESTLTAVQERDEDPPTLVGEFWVFPEIQRCASPDKMFASRGFSKDPDAAVAELEQFPGGAKADVISLSSCREDQIAYEDEQGNTMTSALVDGMMSKPDQSLKDVLLFLSSAMQAQADARHAQAEAYKKECQRCQPRMQAANKKFHARAMTDPDSFGIPSALTRLPTFPARANKSFKNKVALLKKLNLKRRLLDMTFGRASPARFDTQRVQDPEFSGSSPLDMTRLLPL